MAVTVTAAVDADSMNQQFIMDLCIGGTIANESPTIPVTLVEP